MSNDSPLRVTVWDENKPHIEEYYPAGIRGAVADAIKGDGVEVTIAHLDEPDQGISEDLLENTDVLVWWGHARHGEVDDELAAKIKQRVHHGGMGLVVLHSGHYSKPFRATLDCTGHLKGGWRESDDTEEITVCAPWHPIAEGVSNFTLEAEEMYGGPFGTPPVEVLIFQSFFPKGGEVFPCGAVWTVGDGVDLDFTSGPGNGVGQGKGIGRVFYFRPGHETYPTYFHSEVKTIIRNGVLWTGKVTG